MITDIRQAADGQYDIYKFNKDNGSWTLISWGHDSYNCAVNSMRGSEQ